MKRKLAILAIVWMHGIGLAEGPGRWIQHMPTHAPIAGEVTSLVDLLSLPETTGHWVWVFWYDASAGVWSYDRARPYQFSSGAVEFRVPQFYRWYAVFVYDLATGIIY